MWQLLAGKIGFGQPPDNRRSTMSTAHTIKNLYEHYLREFDARLAQELVSNRQLFALLQPQRKQQARQRGGGFPPGAAEPQFDYAPSPRRVWQLHGGPPFMPPANPQQLAQQHQLEQFRQDASQPATMAQMPAEHMRWLVPLFGGALAQTQHTLTFVPSRGGNTLHSSTVSHHQMAPSAASQTPLWSPNTTTHSGSEPSFTFATRSVS
ncbi:hypothetical protein EXIGLDRAFT_730867 [Exidia glandulosa HHB12029]|uniref:Uncharacterized protein n=1 Tax=Exidia glandulosa HHB12029 TaxID=1314781 RepID=A0A165PVU4_EXIGL|nr:hypothetical protein EXIGLDRAFT_730867 [Exidia glandulosa HHB12029]